MKVQTHLRIDNMKIAVAGGKGGTGKSAIALNLAVALAEKNSVTLIDCDVDCPNSYILAGAKLKSEQEVLSFLPEINNEKCNLCGLCVQTCRMNALYKLKDEIKLMPSLCNGCEACKVVCPQDAIGPNKKIIGHTYKTSKHGVNFIIGSLKPTEPISAGVVRETLKRGFAEESDFYIIDVAPGTHCDVVESLQEADLVLLVTEPTPFGAHDLELIKSVLEEIKKPYKIIVNRSDITEQKIKDTYLEIPYDEKMVECYAENIPITIKYPNYKISKIFFDLTDKLR